MSCTFSQVLGAVVDGILPYDQDSSELLQDALAILSSKVSAQPAPAVCQGYTALDYIVSSVGQGYTVIGYIVSPVRVTLPLTTLCHLSGFHCHWLHSVICQGYTAIDSQG